MIIYKAENIHNGKSYIGKTIKTLEERMGGHKYESERYTNKNNSRFYGAINKYGWSSFKWEVIEEHSYSTGGFWRLNEREQYWIEKYDTINKGYNITAGGDGGDVTIGYTKKQMDDFKKKSTIWNTLDKNSAEGIALRKKYGSKGKDHPMYGSVRNDTAKMVTDMNQEEWTCPKCDKSGRGYANKKRWHFNNCRI